MGRPGRAGHRCESSGAAAGDAMLELYSNKFNETGFRNTAKFVANVSERLPHTPVGDFGVNFQFVEDDITPEIADKLKVNDNVDHFFEIAASEITSRIAYKPLCQLNF